MNEKEYIICAANHYDDGIGHVHQPINIITGFVVCGKRHHNCIYTFSLIMKDADGAETVRLMKNETQGFLTSLDRFVDRKEAALIAVLSGQISDESIKKLHSEDLY